MLYEVITDEILPEEQDRAFIQAHVWLQRGRMALSLGRITSYNVCYTKLLRMIKAAIPVQVCKVTTG